jgi:hypothetical protein
MFNPINLIGFFQLIKTSKYNLLGKAKSVLLRRRNELSDENKTREKLYICLAFLAISSLFTYFLIKMKIFSKLRRSNNFAFQITLKLVKVDNRPSVSERFLSEFDKLMVKVIALSEKLILNPNSKIIEELKRFFIYFKDRQILTNSPETVEFENFKEFFAFLKEEAQLPRENRIISPFYGINKRLLTDLINILNK